MTINSGVRTTLTIAFVVILGLTMAACAVTVGDKSVSVAPSGGETQPAEATLSEETAMQTAVAATLTAVAIPTAMPTPSEEEIVQTAVAATLTQVASSQATPEPEETASQESATPQKTPDKSKTPAKPKTPTKKPKKTKKGGWFAFLRIPRRSERRSPPVRRRLGRIGHAAVFGVARAMLFPVDSRACNRHSIT